MREARSHPPTENDTAGSITRGIPSIPIFFCPRPLRFLYALTPDKAVTFVADLDRMRLLVSATMGRRGASYPALRYCLTALKFGFLL